MANVVEMSLVDEPTSPLARIRGLVSDTPKLFKRALTGAGRPSSHPAAADLARLRRSFDLFDADKSGGIDVGELQDCLASLGHDLTDEKARRVFDLIDHDHDGTIDFHEFALIMRRQKQHARWLASVTAEFDTLIKMRSKFDASALPPASIDTYKLRSILEARIDAEHTSEQVERLLEIADADGDGTVDYDEFRAIFETNATTRDLFPCHF